jgi:large subunit ribosomal protein L29
MREKTAKLAELGEVELRQRGEELEKQIFTMRFKMQTGNVENPSRLGEARRGLARIKTLLRERELKIERHRVAKGAGAPGKDRSRG